MRGHPVTFPIQHYWAPAYYQQKSFNFVFYKIIMCKLKEIFGLKDGQIYQVKIILANLIQTCLDQT